MKKKFNFTMVIALLLAFVASSCKKDDNSGSGDLSGLKAVTFPENTEKVLETKTLRELGNGEREVMQLVKKSMLVDPVNVVENSKLEVIYPGSILRGDSFIEGELDNIALVNPKNVTISISLQGKGFNVKRSTLPLVSHIREQINDLLHEKDKNIDFENTSNYLEYDSKTVDTYGSFNRVLKAHASASALFGLVRGSFSFETSEMSLKQSEYVLIKIRQVFFNIAVDPKPYNEWGDLEQSRIGAYEPLYISSVDYGRVAYLLIKTDKSVEEMHKQISGSINAGWFIVKTNGSIDLNEATNKMFRSGEIKVMTLGGPLGYGKDIHDLKTFIRFLMVPSAEELIKSAVPISYKVRTLKDNRTVRVQSFYTEKRVVRQH